MSRDQSLIASAAFLRALGVGMLGVLFALYLSLQGLHAGQIGILIGLGLAGSALGTLFIGLFADRFGRRRTLMALAALSTLGGFGLVLFPQFSWLGVACFLGMVNAMGRERSAFFTLEQAILPQVTEERQRTSQLAWYNLTLDVGQALGSLLGGLPFLFRKALGWGEFPSYQGTFLLYTGLVGLCLFLYMGLSPRVETHGARPGQKVSPKSRRIITRLSLLFGLDSFAGGFLPSSLIAYWFFRRFGVREDLLGPLFFFTHVANALSYLGAAWLSRRIGLVNTMVFTHIPANLCLIAVPFAPTLSVAVWLFILRECLVEMDVPTRQSYLMAVVEPEERTLASGITNLTRLVAWTLGPGLAGLAMKGLSLSFPLFFGGALKILYDLCLYISFRRIKPPEEQPGRP